MATKKMVLDDFEVEYLYVGYPECFPGYGVGPTSRYMYCTYGIGNTEKEALEDCMDIMAQCCGFDFDDEVEQRIRDAYGICDDSTTVADVLGLEDSDDCGDHAWFHVGIKWNEKEVPD